MLRTCVVVNSLARPRKTLERLVHIVCSCVLCSLTGARKTQERLVCMHCLRMRLISPVSNHTGIDDGGGSSGEKVLRLRPTALNKSWDFCARNIIIPRQRGRELCYGTLQKSCHEKFRLSMKFWPPPLQRGNEHFKV